MKNPLKAQIDELSAQNGVLFELNRSAFWPAFAIASALIDRDVIRKNDLLSIIECLISHVSALNYGDFSTPDERILALTSFRDELDQMDLRPGRVHQLMQELEANASVTLENWRRRDS